MKIRNLKPSDRISGYVERILVIENYKVTNPFSLPLFANGLPTLLYKSNKGIMRGRNTTHLTLFGQTILPETITFTEDFTLIAYFFKPYALHAVFNLTALELTDNPVDFNLLDRTQTVRLGEQLLNSENTDSMIVLLDQYISKLISNSRNDCAALRYAANKIAVNTSKDVLTEVQKELHLTERTFQRMFERRIGIAPNLYRRVCQFNAAFQQLNNRNYNRLTDIAFENGYADQSHYIRSFREFTNLRPKDYLNLGRATHD